MRLGVSLGAGGAQRTGPPLPSLSVDAPVVIREANGTIEIDSAGAVSPDGAAVFFTWFRDGRVVPDVFGPSYPVGPGDAGRAVHLSLRYALAGHAPLVVSSNAVRPASAGWQFDGTTILSHPPAPAAPVVSGGIIEVTHA